MILLSNILFEDNKQIGNITFHTYQCIFLVKYVKKYNKKDITERIRALKGVTVVTPKDSPKIDKMNAGTDKYEYGMVEVKFMSNLSGEDEIRNIEKMMVKHDKDNINIRGLVSAKAKDDTLIKLD